MAIPTMNNWIVFKSKDKVVMSLKGLLSKGCLSDKSERNVEGEKWRRKEVER